MLDRKRKTKDPCARCFLNKKFCICEEMQSFETRTRLVLLVHYKELKRTTNTGRLATTMLANSEMHIRGKGPIDLSGLAIETYHSVLLFPTEDAVELSEAYVATIKKPFQLIVPDGNWRQASKVHTRHSELKDIPRVKLPQSEPATQFLRKEHVDNGMATLQAISLAMGILENREAEERLAKVYDRKLAMTLKSRGLTG